ncbi:hypothetical protein [Flagellimonas zhangzhouensis]|uniref:Uncharacterized protein n=1 Tax=Flagellimonas zhangzhouensis TaxID=1073328 RepID=A0A1H2QUN3_9FLAO|nr:hypothetical protein [Allomuricauda zhangzhouensis]SDQ56708.1 hypothetical protein SAMN05216294_1712 [Allomuricauda zhangzhouensis]SDW10628.1 hypothetical protein SAMN04487892_0364 [Allomuricauda zhangzhouensis]
MTLSRTHIILFSIATLLLVPFIAMQFSSEVQWSAFDFLVAGILLSSLGFSINFILKKSKEAQKRLLWVSVIVGLFLLLWAEIAVGVFGSPIAGS